MLINDNALGFSNASTGGHSARSMMFLEMRALVRAMPLTVTKNDFTKAIVEENPEFSQDAYLYRVIC